MAKISSLLQYAYKKVDERDGRTCIHPGCGRTNIDHHHIEARSQARDRISCVENIVTLCHAHHHGREGPHESSFWREHWKKWQKERYPYYMPKADQNEMERLRLKRFADPRVTERLEELERKWQRWEKCRLKA